RDLPAQHAPDGSAQSRAARLGQSEDQQGRIGAGCLQGVLRALGLQLDHHEFRRLAGAVHSRGYCSMKKIRSDQARDYFQERVKVNAKTLIDMGDIMRRYPGQFTHQDVEKVRVYLMRQLEAALNGMNIAVSTAVRTDFDFDMEIPPT